MIVKMGIALVAGGIGVVVLVGVIVAIYYRNQ